MLKPLLNVFHAALCVGLVSASIPCNAAELVLVEDGVALAPIVIFADAPPKTRRAADELADYIEKTTGARPDVLEGQPDPLPDRAIWVGVQPALNELFPELDFDFQHPEEILIAANEAHLVIAGRDRWDPEHLRVQRGRDWVIGWQQAYGTANAVYTFLQDYLGVRWLWPGALGVELAERPTLAFEPFTYRYHPPIRHRSGAFYLSRKGGRHGQSHAWTRVQRIKLDSLDVSPSSHGFTDWWERFHETHPEYFALQPDGSRTWPNPRTVKICQSNPAVWEQWIEDIDAALAENPNVNAIDAGPNDGWSSGHCICEHCRAWDHPEGEVRQFHWSGLVTDYVALSDRDVTFYNQLARLAKQRFPDREFYVRGSAYGHTRPAPIAVVPADNVLITAVSNFLLRPDYIDRGSTLGTPERQQFKDWGAVTQNFGWRPNISGWVRRGLPDVQLAHIRETWPFIAEHHVTSLTIDTFQEFWATHGPMYYLIAQLTWNPHADGDAIMADYFARGFGPAAADVTAYWALIEAYAVRYRDGGYDGYRALYDEAFFVEAGALLDQAAQQVAEAPERFGQRVAFVRTGLSYTQLYLELIDVMARYRQSAEQDSDAADRAFAIWETFAQMDKTQPYAIHWHQIHPRRSLMRDLFPGDWRTWAHP